MNHLTHSDAPTGADGPPASHTAYPGIGAEDRSLTRMLPVLIGELGTGPLAVARIIDVTGSSPRDPGATMAVNSSGEVFGSVTGGCVEGSVYEICREVLTDGQPVTHRFSRSFDLFAPQLTCGGEVTVRVERWGAEHRAALLDLQRFLSGDPVPEPPDARGSTVTGDRSIGLATSPGHAELCSPDRIPDDGALVHRARRKPDMVIVGSTDFVAATAQIAAVCGYRVTVLDAREPFTTPRRFPAAHRVVCDWPARWLHRNRAVLDERGVVLVLTHDPKIDIPVLQEVLGWDTLAYVGAMGSASADHRRRAELRELGVDLGALHSPVGIPIGNRGPEETAVSIMADIIACRPG